jgi:hypothetical protein
LVLVLILLKITSPALASEPHLLFSLPNGPRGAAIGECYVALPQWSETAASNPATLGFQGGVGMTYLHSPWLTTLESSADAGRIYRWGLMYAEIPTVGTFAVTYGRLDWRQEGYISRFDPSKVAYTMSNDSALALSLGMKVSEHFAAGIALKRVLRQLPPEFTTEITYGLDAKAIAADFGVSSVFESRRAGVTFSMGSSISNVGTLLKYSREELFDDLPQHWSYGASMSVERERMLNGRSLSGITITGAVEGRVTMKGRDNTSFGGGVEIMFMETVGLSAGYRNGPRLEGVDRQGLSYGVTLVLKSEIIPIPWEGLTASFSASSVPYEASVALEEDLRQTESISRYPIYGGALSIVF